MKRGLSSLQASQFLTQLLKLQLSCKLGELYRHVISFDFIAFYFTLSSPIFVQAESKAFDSNLYQHHLCLIYQYAMGFVFRQAREDPSRKFCRSDVQLSAQRQLAECSMLDLEVWISSQTHKAMGFYAATSEVKLQNPLVLIRGLCWQVVWFCLGLFFF